MNDDLIKLPERVEAATGRKRLVLLLGDIICRAVTGTYGGLMVFLAATGKLGHPWFALLVGLVMVICSFSTGPRALATDTGKDEMP